MPAPHRPATGDGFFPPGASRTPPHSEEAEVGVLGSIFQDPERVPDLCAVNGIVEDSFYIPAHRIVYSAILEVGASGAAVDVLTVANRLQSMNRLETVGGAQALQSLIDATPTAAHAEYYIDIVRQKHLLRSVIDCAREAEKACFEEDCSADIVVSNAEQAFLSITDHQHGSILPWTKSVDQTVNQLVHLLSMGPGAFTGLSTGFRDLDKFLRGLRGGEVIVLAARPSMGKTSLAMNICECVALGQTCMRLPAKGDHANPKAVAIFSLEMPQEQLAMRMLCSRARISRYQLDSGIAHADKVIRQLSTAANELKAAKLFVDDTAGLDVAELRARARRLCRKHEIRLIMIDYLQLMNCSQMAKQGRQLETAKISSQIKEMAKELKVPVILLSQLSRSADREGSGIPKLSDLRDSGAIEQDADVVLLLRRPIFMRGGKDAEANALVDPRLAIVDVAKNRNGPVGEVNLDFDADFTQFSDRAENAGADYGPSGESFP
ncbi:MAG: replicative DNA helicase [Kiritimatiellia bacterium]|jgi:replicative DNA helicase